MRNKEDLPEKEIQLVSFKLGRETFAVYVNKVREIGKVEEITHVPNVPEFVEGVMGLRGQITTVINLRRKFRINGGNFDLEQSKIIVADVGENQIGIIVDSVQDVIRVSPQIISPPPDVVLRNVENKFLLGVCKLEDGLVMLLDLDFILNEDEKDQLGNIKNEEIIKDPT
ncbi:MAG: chemotaxis protein CheW [Candidatus Thorarchaeota archaeon]